MGKSYEQRMFEETAQREKLSNIRWSNMLPVDAGKTDLRFGQKPLKVDKLFLGSIFINSPSESGEID